MTKEEMAYMEGSRMAWTAILHECLRQLGYSDIDARKARWVPEREAAVSMLRSVCREYGDNDWPNELHLADIIEKHLWRPLRDGTCTTGDDKEPR